MRNPICATALLVCLACGSDTKTSPSPAHGAWAAAGPGAITVVGDGITTEPSVKYSFKNPDPINYYTKGEWTLRTTAPRAATVTLPFTYVGNHGYYDVSVWVRAMVWQSGVWQERHIVIAEQAAECCTPPSGGFNLTGSYTFDVASGEEYGFEFGGMNDDLAGTLDGTFSITNTP